MLQVIIPGKDFWDETAGDSGEFRTSKTETLQLEHSLVSLSRWESKWCKPFLTKDEKTLEETIDYIRCMTVTQNVNPTTYLTIPVDVFAQVKDYIDSKQTATWFAEDKTISPNREVITSELIYYWMIAQNIPIECQKWHLNRLLTLIRVCSVKNAPNKKQSRREMLAQRKALNASRRARGSTKG